MPPEHWQGLLEVMAGLPDESVRERLIDLERRLREWHQNPPASGSAPFGALQLLADDGLATDAAEGSIVGRLAFRGRRDVARTGRPRGGCAGRCLP